MIITPMHELMRIEPATIEDLSLLAELLMELFGQEPDFRPDYNNQMRGLSADSGTTEPGANLRPSQCEQNHWDDKPVVYNQHC